MKASGMAILLGRGIGLPIEHTATRRGRSLPKSRLSSSPHDKEPPMLDDAALDQIFRQARTHNAFSGEVTDAQLRALWDLMKFGPTTANSQPARIVFVRSREAKERLKPALNPGNVDKTMSAPVTAILAYDLEFYQHLPRLFPHNPAMKDAYVGEDKKQFVATVALRNASLQGGYFIIAARALGIDTGPMSGFNNALVDEAFFAGTTWRSNFLCNLGRGDPSKLFPRSPRLAFDEACKIV
jgi:3-hydroxypropanoate dehydrogenase